MSECKSLELVPNQIRNLSTMRRIFALPLVAILASTPVLAQERHPAMENSWWTNLGSFFAERDFKASANATIGGINREFDFERDLGLDDSPTLIMGELGWQFAENWGVALQYFGAKRDASRTLDDTFDWQGNTYDIGVRVDASTRVEITRIFFARRFRDSGPHSLRLGGGIHWLNIRAEISGQARLDDESTEFRRSSATASVPVPNIGAWYRYSSNDRWMANARIDWMSASIDNYSGAIWNGSVGINYAFGKNFGVGASYQYFQLAGDVTEDNWRGALEITFTGPFLYVSGFW